MTLSTYVNAIERSLKQEAAIYAKDVTNLRKYIQKHPFCRSLYPELAAKAKVLLDYATKSGI